MNVWGDEQSVMNLGNVNTQCVNCRSLYNWLSEPMMMRSWCLSMNTVTMTLNVLLTVSSCTVCVAGVVWAIGARADCNCTAPKSREMPNAPFSPPFYPLSVAAISPKSWGVQSWGHLSPSANPPFSPTLVDYAWVWAEPVQPLPNILMQFTQSNSFIKFTLMFNVLPGTENSMHATVGRTDTMDYKSCRAAWH